MHFVTTRYTVKHHKVREPLTAVLVTDLHSADTGNDNRDLLDAISREVPDLIIAAGDMVMGNPDASYERGLHFAKALPEIAPTFSSNGNHERRLRLAGEHGKGAYGDIMRGMEESGVVILNN
ncbi:MAG: metallophosphoesterase, partial [Lachnospiraceae bacterium]|nr:metallophosphoesterase [Lachnospiraceae bacterium]